MKSLRDYSRMLFILSVCIAFMGCAYQTQRHHSSSVYEYLYSDKKDHIESPSIPVLSLPLRVGIAFVPENSGGNYTLTERDKMDLMNEVAKHFKKYKFVKDIELIPSAYTYSIRLLGRQGQLCQFGSDSNHVRSGRNCVAFI